MTSQDLPKDQSRVGYLFGYPIKHSLSPIVHQLVYKHLSLDYTYTLYESTNINSFLHLTQAPNFYGAAITMPHKVAIIPHLHALTPEGRAVGAINTVFPRPNPRTGARELHGTNTDCIGIREALRQNMAPAALAAARGRPALVVGGGGTSRAAVYALTQWLGAGPVYMVNRDAGEVADVMGECAARGFGAGLVHVAGLEQARGLPAPAVVVSAIPDFEPVTEAERGVREMIVAVLGRERGTILEMCYHPSPDTAVTRIAIENGWTVIPGTEAMVWQGLEQDKYWTGRDVKDMPVEEVKVAVAEALEKARSHI
jgi:quinate dehydrogenase